MDFYHYTSILHLHEILTDKYLKLTPSNLKFPKNLRIENGVAVSDTDGFHPVVWLSDVLDFDTAKGNGIEGSCMDKTQCAIVVHDTPGRNIIPYQDLVDKYTPYLKQKDFKWIEGIKDTGPNHPTRHVSEEAIKIDETTRIVFRPDIMERLEAGESVEGFRLPSPQQERSVTHARA